MLPKNYKVVQMDHIHDILWVVLLEELQDLELYTRLVIVLLFVLDNFDGDFEPCLVVEALYGCSK